MKIESIAPKQDNVLVQFRQHAQRREELEQTPGGIFIPKAAEAPSHNAAIEAVVIAVGPGYYSDKFVDHEQGTAPLGSPHFIKLDAGLKPGAKVLLEARAAAADRVWSDTWEEYRMVRADCICAVVEE